MLKKQIPATTTKTQVVNLNGGLDQLTPTLSMRPGYVRDALNFEQSINGGYARIKGYECFDGRANPSDASYQSFRYTGALFVGDVITGVTSGATATVTWIGYSSSGVVPGPVAAITAVTGGFEELETIEVGGLPVAVVDIVGMTGDGADWGASQLNLAADHYRALIQAVPGQGSTLGVAYFQSMVFAFRRRAASTALDLYKSTTGGWVQVPFVNEISFTAGSTEYAEGSTVSRGGASATVRRVVLESGTWAGGTAAGRLIIGTVTGGPFTAGVAGGGGVVTLSGAEAAIAMTAPGIVRVEMESHNFGAGQRLYGADGVNRHWEFDGTYLVPISTPVPGLFPKHIVAHQGHLFYSIQSSLFCSGIGLPYDSQAISGAAEILAAGEINSLARLPGDQTTGALLVGSENETQVLYGSSAADFQLKSFEDSAGAKDYSVQRLGGQVFAFSNIGAYVVSTTTQYGNFVSNTITANIRPWIQGRRSLLTGSQINREKSQYRMFFSDGSALYVTFANGKLIGLMPMAFEHAVVCVCQGETPDGSETGFFGSTDGFVYRLDAGTSFDGEPIDYRLVMTWGSQGNARVLKRYRRMSFEVQGTSYGAFYVTHGLGYESELIPQGSDPLLAELALSTPTWDSGLWDELTWDSVSLRPTEVELSGTAENLSITVAGSDDRFDAFTINSMAIHYSPRRLMR